MRENEKTDEILLKSGKDLVDDFFNNLDKLHDVDSDIVHLLQTLYSSGRLQRDEILRELKKLRETWHE